MSFNCSNIPEDIISLSANKKCLDCGKEQITHVNLTIGSFVCYLCAEILRGLKPPHDIRLVNSASFTTNNISFLKAHGNQICTHIWMNRLEPKDFYPKNQDVSHLALRIRQKYIDKFWMISTVEYDAIRQGLIKKISEYNLMQFEGSKKKRSSLMDQVEDDEDDEGDAIYMDHGFESNTGSTTKSHQNVLDGWNRSSLESQPNSPVLNRDNFSQSEFPSKISTSQINDSTKTTPNPSKNQVYSQSNPQTSSSNNQIYFQSLSQMNSSNNQIYSQSNPQTSSSNNQIHSQLHTQINSLNDRVDNPFQTQRKLENKNDSSSGAQKTQSTNDQMSTIEEPIKEEDDVFKIKPSPDNRSPKCKKNPLAIQQVKTMHTYKPSKQYQNWLFDSK